MPGISKLPPKPPVVEKPNFTLKERQRCPYCLGWHLRFCPRVKRIVFTQTSIPAPLEIEFWEQFDDSATIYEDDERYEIEVTE